MKLDDFEKQYLATALWSTNDNSTPQGGDPFDANFTLEDFSSEALYQAWKECHRFQLVNAELLQKAYAAGIDPSTAGHDFWLTRNGHGAGFWDGDYPEEIGDKLTLASKQYGELNIYEGKDGLLYFE